MTLAELEKMRNSSFDEIDPTEIVGFGDLEIDTLLPVEERILAVLNSNINPYFRKTKDGCIVKISFVNNGTTFQENFLKILTKKV